MFRIVEKIVSIIILIVLLPVLFVNSVIIIDSFVHPDEIPSFFGWKPFIVLSGSMETEIFAGDLAVVKEVDPEIIKENDIIAFKHGGIVTTHRVVRITEEDGVTKYITKGDNNNVEDSGFVLQEQVEGIYQFKMDNLGNLAMFVQTPIGMMVCLSIPLALLLLIQLVESNNSKKYIKEKQSKEKELKEEIERLKKQNEDLLRKESNEVIIEKEDEETMKK